MSYTIHRCSHEQYPEFLTMLTHAFGYEHGWFENNYPHCTPPITNATDDEIKKNFIAVNEGKVIGGTGAYEMDWVIADSDEKITVKTFGIGMVSCLPAYRNQGVMSALMKKAAEEMKSTGHMISFLSGDRFRYGFFGYGFGGNTVKFHLDKYRLENNIPHLEINIKKAGLPDCEQLSAMYEQLPSYMKRNTSQWRRYIEDEKVTFIMGEHKGRQGYICNKDFCVEAAGDHDIVLNLLIHFMREHSKNHYIVGYPYMKDVPDALSEALYKAAMWVEVVPFGLFNINNTEALFDQVSGIIKKQTRQNINGLSVKQKELILRRLFGYVYHPLAYEVTDFNDIHPVCAWVSELDNV